MKDLQKILTGYLVCALWTEEKFDGRTIEEIGESTKATALREITEFVAKAGELLNDLEDEQIGHDFWLTRNNHGAGFWDRGLGEVGQKLTEIAQTFKALNLWESECDVIYFE